MKFKKGDYVILHETLDHKNYKNCIRESTKNRTPNEITNIFIYSDGFIHYEIKIGEGYYWFYENELELYKTKEEMNVKRNQIFFFWKKNK